MLVQDGQTDFSGGMNDRLSPELLPDNQYAFGQNLEIRDGRPKTRRCDLCIHTWPDDVAVKEVLSYHAPYQDSRRACLIMARGTSIYRRHPGQQYAPMTAPASVDAAAVWFIQAFDYVYMLMGEGITPWYWDGNPTTGFLEVAAPAVGDAMPKVDYGIAAYNRLWLVHDNDNVAASDVLSDTFDLTLHSWQVNSGEGGKIMVLVPFGEGNILVLKESSTWLWTGCNGDLSAGSMMIEPLDMNHGCVSQRGAVQVGNDVWFISNDGVRSVRLTELNKTQLVDLPVSNDIPQLWGTCNPIYQADNCAAIFDNYALFSVKQASQIILVYDLTLKCWVGAWIANSAKWLLTGKNNQAEVLYAIDQYGDTWEMLKGFGYEGVEESTPYFTYTSNAKWQGNIDPAQMSSDTTGEIVVCANWASAYTDDYYTLVLMQDSVSGGGSLHISLNPLTANVICTLSVSGSTKWTFNAPIPSLLDSAWHTLSLRQAGGSDLLSLWVDGSPVTITYTVTTDKTKWLTDILSDPAHDYLLRIGSLTRADGQNMKIKWVKVLRYENVPATDGQVKMCVLPSLWLSTPAAWNVGDTVSNDLLTATGTTTIETPTAEAELLAILKTRGYSFGYPDLLKRFRQGIVGLINSYLKFSVLGITPREPSVALLTDVTYALTAWDVALHADWDGTGATFNDLYRKAYSPVTLTAAGMTLPSAGIKLDTMVPHSESFYMSQIDKYVQLYIYSTNGMMGLTGTKLVASLLSKNMAKNIV